MVKGEILDLIKKCYTDLYDLLNNKKETLSKKEIRKYQEALIDAGNDINDALNMNENDEFDQKRLNFLAKKYVDLYKELKGKKEKFTKKTNYTPLLGKENVPALPGHVEKEKENSGCLNYVLAFGAGALAMLLITIACKNIKFENKPVVEEDNDLQNEIQIDDISSIEGLDLNNEVALKAYATMLASSLPDDVNISEEQIINAIKLANFEKMNNNREIFADREDVYESTLNIGEVAHYTGLSALVQKDKTADIYLSEDTIKNMLTNVVQDRLTLENFKDAKSENGYDIYSLLDICTENLNMDTDEAKLYAKMLNDLVARHHVNGTVCNGVNENGRNSLLSTYYVTLGVYNREDDRSLELTALAGAAIYGDGYRVEEDGRYGNICVEEIIKYTAVGNENNMFYSDIIDENILSPNRGISR